MDCLRRAGVGDERRRSRPHARRREPSSSRARVRAGGHGRRPPRMRNACSGSRRAAFAISPVSPPVRPRCGATSVSRIATRSGAVLADYQSELARIAQLLAQGDGAMLEQVFTRARDARDAWVRGKRALELVSSAHEFLDLGPFASRSRHGSAAGLEEHLEPRAAAVRRSPRVRRRSAICSPRTTPNACSKRFAALGVRIDRVGGETVRVQGCAGSFPVKAADLFLGNAGTALRPLTAALALSGGHYRLSGVPRMHERPIGDLVDGAARALARISSISGTQDFPPIEIRPTPRSAPGGACGCAATSRASSSPRC